jgi:hypothetical protein
MDQEKVFDISIQNTIGNKNHQDFSIQKSSEI